MTSTPRSIPVEVLSERRRVAEALRHFAAGRTTNREFERALETTPSSGFYDPVLDSVEHFAWLMYDDFETHRLDGKRKLSREARRAIARWIFFLRSDCESVEGSPEIQQGAGLLALSGYLLSLFLLAAVPIVLGVMIAGSVGGLIGLAVLMAAICVFGSRGTDEAEILAQDRAFATEDKSVWPFRSRGEFAAALARPTFLAGTR